MEPGNQRKAVRHATPYQGCAEAWMVAHAQQEAGLARLIRAASLASTGQTGLPASWSASLGWGRDPDTTDDQHRTVTLKSATDAAPAPLPS